MRWIVLLLAFSGSLSAQDEPPPRRWSTSGEISYVSTSGNTETRTIGTAAELLFRGEVWKSELKGSWVDSESDGEQQARVISGLAAMSRTLFSRIDAYGRGSYLRNRFAGIDQRVAIEAGAAWETLQSERQLLRIEAGLGRTTEERITVRDLSFATARGGVSYKWRLSDTASFSNVFSLTQNLESGADWRIDNIAALSAALNSLLSLKLSHSLNHQNEPIPDFVRTDTTVSAAIVVRY